MRPAHSVSGQVLSQFDRFIRLGCTLGGSPGIFGVRSGYALCNRAWRACSDGALWAKLSGMGHHDHHDHHNHHVGHLTLPAPVVSF